MSASSVIPTACAGMGLVLLAAGSGSAPAATASARSAASRDAPARECSERMPLAFEENRGQTDARARFLVRDRGMVAFICGTETVLALHSSVARKLAPGDDVHPGDAELRTEVVRMRCVGANDAPSVEGRDPLPGRCNYFTGNDPTRWVTDVPTCGRVVVRDAWPGVDVVWRGGEGGRLTYDLVLAPGAEVAAVAFEFEGASETGVERDGSLRVAADLGELRHTRPVAYQFVDGMRREVDAAFAVAEDGRVGLTVGARDARRPLVIDPSLTYSTYLGGGNTTSAGDIGYCVAVDSAGAAYVAGHTPSADFPTQSAFQSSLPATISGFVSKINASGSALVWSTYLGGTTGSPTRPRAIAVDGSGAAYVTGETAATNFPTQSPLQGSSGGGLDGFVTKLDPSGSSLAWSTYLGGSGNDNALAITVDGGGAAHVTGTTYSTDFPTQVPLQPAHAGGSEDAFVAKVNAAGSALVYSTYLGGSGVDRGNSIAIDSTGNACVGGDTLSTDFPTQSPLQGTHGGGNFDVFVAKLNASGSALAWSTYLGGSARDHARGVAIDSSGSVYVAGYTDPNGLPGYSQSADFPTAAAFQGTRAGGTDAFVAKLSASGSTLAYSTFLGGGSGNDVALGVAVDSGGAATIVGSTWSTDFPTASPSQASFGGGSWDVFVAKLGANGSALVFSTYLGGSGADEGKGIALDSTGAAYVTGNTSSTNFPLQSALQATYGGGGSDAFVAKYPLGTGGPPSGPPPSAPIDLVATYEEDTGVSLSWTDTSSDETGFRVERMPQGYTFALLATTPADTTSLADATRLYPSTTYTYRVRAFNDGGNSAWSNEDSITTSDRLPVPAPPLAPTELRAEALEDGTVWLSWKDRSADEVGFALQRTDGGAVFGPLAYPRPDVTSWIDATVHPGWPCAYRVAAFSLRGPSPWSDTATATVPATLDLAVTSGTLVDSTKPRRDGIKLSATYASTAEALDPVAYGLELRLGFATAPLTLSIPADDPGWKLRTTKERRGRPASVVRATWKSPKGVTPKVAVTVDFARQVLTASVSGAVFAPRIGDAPPVGVLLACGAAAGAHSADWTEGKAGVFKFKAK